MKTELISIITPVYNAEKFLNDTANSVLNQTYPHFEWLLVDDCSSDHSVQIIKSLQQEDSRVQLVQLSENSGAAVARNAGIAQAEGRFIAFLDSDDKWAFDKLEKQIDVMIQHHYGFTYTDFGWVDVSGAIIKAQTGIPEQLNYTELLKNTTIACSTVMIDRDIVGDFRMPLVRKGQDTATWLMLMRERGVIAHGVPEVLSYYRQVPGSVSSNRLGALKRTWYTYYHLEKLPFPRAAYYFMHYVMNALKRRL